MLWQIKHYIIQATHTIKMSLTASSICLSAYIGIPSEVTNMITSYACLDSTKWIPRIDPITGKLSFTVNKRYFTSLLSRFSATVIDNEYRMYSRVVNGLSRFITITYAQHYVNDGFDISISIYTTVEVSPEVFEGYHIHVC